MENSYFELYKNEVYDDDVCELSLYFLGFISNEK